MSTPALNKPLVPATDVLLVHLGGRVPAMLLGELRREALRVDLGAWPLMPTQLPARLVVLLWCDLETCDLIIAALPTLRAAALVGFMVYVDQGGASERERLLAAGVDDACTSEVASLELVARIRSG